jgi:hypothetical protein
MERVQHNYTRVANAALGFGVTSTVQSLNMFFHNQAFFASSSSWASLNQESYTFLFV